MKNESVKKSLEESKNVLEKRKMVKPKKLHKKDQHVYSNCYELRSKEIKRKAPLSEYFQHAVLNRLEEDEKDKT